MFAIDCRTGCEVVGVSAKDKTVELKDLATGAVTTESYDKLVLSPGAAPIRPPLPGIDLPGIFPVRTVPDAAAVREWVQSSLTELPGLDSYTGRAGPKEAAPRRRRRRRVHRSRDGREPLGARPRRHRRAARRPAHGAGRPGDGALRRAAHGEPRRPHPAERRRVRLRAGGRRVARGPHPLRAAAAGGRRGARHRRAAGDEARRDGRRRARRARRHPRGRPDAHERPGHLRRRATRSRSSTT